MARKAVAASLAAVVLMTALVAADAAVMSAQDNLASFSQVAHVESRELLLERYAAGVVSMEVLQKVVGQLVADAADCSDLPAYLDSINSTAFFSGVDSGISFKASAAVTSGVTSFIPQPDGDNLTTVAPFSGYLGGALNLRTIIKVFEAGGGGSVSLERRETHTLDLPISRASASSLCGSALASLSAALSRAPCNSTVEQESFVAALRGLVSAAQAHGFTLTAGWGEAGSGCSIGYWFTLVEPRVAGPTGSFDWTVHGSGTA